MFFGVLTQGCADTDCHCDFAAYRTETSFVASNTRDMKLYTTAIIQCGVFHVLQWPTRRS